ncbi:putative LRR receptor-like serine/threonine-protein kinase [Dichanthelium oligosanthes]|uniref:Receptor kinase-like protein Xa21 n=1 Tax=Dichanthelium oligosanthes TaxID=888268 RepID=A0A1E5UUJ5_9POAL|nr:putative LRR receptor-like serine/threonine-protein kinase [Dichanthelium oligosanthes]
MVSLAIVITVMLLWRRKQRPESVTLPSFSRKIPKVSYNDLAKATMGFSTSNLIGRGRYSSVYQGKLFQGRTMVAIKVFSLEIKGAHKSFIAECSALRNVRHRNLVPILTACSSIDLKGNDFKTLVYELMPRGDLHALLYMNRDDANTPTPSCITLAQKLSIAVDVADALEYLHHSNQGTIVHCDLKPSNILLDENMTARIGDFVLARFKVDSTASSLGDSISTSSVAIRGTIGYVAPECAAGGGVSSPGDVYSFGIVLLEIFLRKRPTDDMFNDGLNIVKFVETNFPDRILRVVDPELQEELGVHEGETSGSMKEKSLEFLLSVTKIGLDCAKASPNARMGMQKVASKLHRVKDAYLMNSKPWPHGTTAPTSAAGKVSSAQQLAHAVSPLFASKGDDTKFRKLLQPLGAMAAPQRSYWAVPNRTAPGLRQLQISVNDLAGTIPASLANITTLNAISCADNHFEGSVPDEFAKLQNLQQLYMGANQLSGRFPRAIMNLSALTDLSLALNQFSGEVPPDLGSTLRNLLLLELPVDFFQGQIPPSLTNASDLYYIEISRNNFSGVVPASVGNLTNQLQYLYLAENQLSGEFPPGIANLQNLFIVSLAVSQFSELNLESNRLVGKIPQSFGNLPILKVLKISDNNLYGSIPKELFRIPTIVQICLYVNNLDGIIHPDIGNARQLTYLQLSSNNLSGEIPSTLGNCESLEGIEFDHNSFSGSIPASLGNIRTLKVLSLSHNNLTGSIPASKGNLQLLEQLDLSLNNLQGEMTKSISLPFGREIPKISYNDLSRATEGFAASNLIGQGRYGSVYQGKLFQDEKVVAIKVFSIETRRAQKSFIAECNALRNVRHRNLVPILTACSTIDSNGNDFKALVYEFMPRGDFHNLFYPARDSEGSSYWNYVSLDQRLSILVDVSDPLAYLHYSHQGIIVHCDLKPSNILLDDDMVAHVGDFGLSRFKSSSTTSYFADSYSISSIAINGTIGYVAPECSAGGQVSIPSDVYSFRVVLLEIFIRRRPTDDMKDRMSIAKFAEINFPENVLQIVDPQLLEELELSKETPVVAIEDSGAQILQSVLSIGLCCTKTSPSERINMQEAAAKLHGIIS